MTAIAREASAKSLAPADAKAEEAFVAALASRGGRDGAPKPRYLAIAARDAAPAEWLPHLGAGFASVGDDTGAIGGGRFWGSEDAAIAAFDATAIANPDDGAWPRFGALLGQRRLRQPFNGILATLPVDALAMSGEDEPTGPAAELVQALREADKVFGARPPVYVIVSKLDRLTGFGAYFGRLSAVEREQVWGATFRLGEGGSARDRCSRAFDILAARIEAGLIDQLRGESDRDSRAAILEFPQQFARLKRHLASLIEAIETEPSAQGAARVRGFYFLNAEPETPAVDLKATDLAKTFGVAPPLPRAPASQGSRYFVKRLFAESILPERNWIDLHSQVSPSARRGRMIAASVAVALALAALSLFALDFRATTDEIAAAAARLEAYRSAAEPIPARDVADVDFASVEHALGLLRNPDAPTAPANSSLGVFGSTELFESGFKELYGRALDVLLRPRLLVALQGSARAPVGASNGEPDVYFMIGGRRPINPQLTKSVLAALFQRVAPGPGRESLRSALNQDVAALLERPLPPMELDPLAVQNARDSSSAAPAP
jgi:type VI protein secretion system component VasK